MLHFDLIPERRTSVCAVAYLNTVPLVWGMLHGGQKDVFDLTFTTPAECADRLSAGATDIGLVPCAELNRLGLAYLPGLGIACDGPVRSILLAAKRPLRQVRTLAADSSSRTSVSLARIILAERYGAEPEIQSRTPDLEAMLEHADAALIIGDPALRLDPAALPYDVYDLGAEWREWTGLPMVFAVWAGRPEVITPEAGRVFAASYEYGRAHLEDIVARADEYGLPPDLVRRYLTRHIKYELAERERRGLELFQSKAAARSRLAGVTA